MNHVKLNDEYRQMLLESAAWGKADISVDAQPEAINESAEETQEEVIEEEAHICPLCISQLENPIEPERVVEHLEIVANVLDRLEQLNESNEDIDLEEAIYSAVQEVLLESDDEESDEDEVIEEDGEISEEEFYDEDSEEVDEEEEVVEEAYGKKKSGKPIPSMGKGYKTASKAMKQPKKGTC